LLGDARHGLEVHDADLRIGQGEDFVRHQPEREKASAHGLAIDEADQSRAALPGDFEALREVAQVAVDAEQLVAPRQPLAGRVHQHDDGTLGMVAGALEHALRQRERVFHADLRVVGGSDHGHVARGRLRGPMHDLIVDGYAVAEWKQALEQFAELHCVPLPDGEKKLVGFQQRQIGGIGDALCAPDIDCVGELSVARATFLESRLLRFERLQRQWSAIAERRERGRAKVRNRIRNQRVRFAEQIAMLAPVVRHTSARSRESNSSTPFTVSITSGPDSASRPSSDTITWSQHRATMPTPPKQPLAPPMMATTGTPATRAASSAG
jgi:hypothetical protein